MYHARELAMSRMRSEATDMGADGIVGVRLTITRLPWNNDMLEFMAFGTGVIHEHGRTGFRAHDGGPFTSDLSGQDFWSLLHAGYRPVEMVMGSCVYHVSQRGFTVGNVNVEMTQFTAAMYEAREIAMERMQSEAADAPQLAITRDRVFRDRHCHRAPPRRPRPRENRRPHHGPVRKRLVANDSSPETSDYRLRPLLGSDDVVEDEFALSVFKGPAAV